MCRKIAVSETQWEEVEIATEALRLFDRKVMPRFTHGICASCFEAAMSELAA